MKTRVKAVRAGLTLLACLGGFAQLSLPALAFAGGTELSINSPLDGQIPYLVVIADQQGNSKRAPGIYAANAEGQYDLLIAGNVLRGGASQGIIEHLTLSKVTGRHEALTVVDGNLYLIQQNTAGDASTFNVIHIGSDEFPITDSFTGEPSRLPPIHTLDDITVFVGEPGTHGQILVASVKTPGTFYGENSITFGMLVTPKVATKPWVSSMAHAPIALDTSFHTKVSLSTLLHREATGATGVISSRVLKFYGRPHPEDPPSLSVWRESMRATAERFLSQTWPSNGKVSQIPYVDLVDGRTKLVKEPGIDVITSPIRIYQYYNPVTGRDRIEFVGHTDRLGQPQREQGRMDLNVARDSYATFTSSDSPSVIAQFGGEIVFIRETRDPIDQRSIVTMNKLSSGKSETPDELAFVETTQNSGDSKATYLFVSTKKNNKGSTEVYVFSDRDGSTSLIKRLEIFPHYLPQNELKNRIRADAKETHGAVLFDNRTEAGSGVEAYRQIFRDTIPLLDVGRTTSMNQVEQGYLKPLEAHNIDLGVEYHRYDNEGARTQQSGLIIKNPQGNKALERQSGELLFTPGKSGALHHILGKKSISTHNGITAQVTIIAMDSGFQGGAKAFTAKILITFSKSPMSHEIEEVPAPMVIDERFDQPFGSLEGVQMITGEKSGSEDLHVFFSFRARDEKNPGQLIERAVSLLKSQPGVKFPITVTPRKRLSLSERFFSLADLSRRLRAGKDGRLFWVETPDLQEVESGFKIRNLILDKEVMLNSPEGRSLKLTDLSAARESSGGDEDGYSDRYATWRASSAFTFRRYFREHGYTMAEHAEPKEVSAALEDYLELNGALEDLVNPARPIQHVVYLVSEAEKPLFLSGATALLGNNNNQHWSDVFKNKLEPYLLRSDKATQAEFLDNLNHIRGLQSGQKGIVVADAKDLVAINVPLNGEELADQTLLLRSPLDPKETMAPHALYLLGTEGEKVEVADLKSGHLPHAMRTRTMIVATPAEWNLLRQQVRQVHQDAILGTFNVEYKFFSMTWRVWPSRNSKATAEIKAFREKHLSEAEVKIIPNLMDTVVDLADVHKPARHRVLIVPEDLKSFVQNTLLTRWVGADPDDHGNVWSEHNPNLRLHRFSNSDAAGQVLNQHQILTEMAALRGSPQGRSMILVDAAQISDPKNSRPTAPATRTGTADTFTLEDYAANKEGTGHVPHLIYLLASDGRRLTTDEFEKKKAQGPEISQLILATEREWAAIERDTAFEQRFGVLQNYEIQRITSPSVETKTSLLEIALDRPQVKGLGYQFDPEGKMEADAKSSLTPEERRRKVLSYLVSRTESLARQFGQESTTSFLRVLGEFDRAIVEDPSLRATRMISRSFVERLLAKSFGIPLNLNILPSDDPLVILSNEDKAAYRLQQAGYEGPLELKLKFIRAINSQTRAGGDTRKIPSSIIMLGDSGSGKTYLFESLVKMLGLKYYDFNPPNATANEDAEALVINFNNVRAESKAGAETEKSGTQIMTPKEVREHIEKFLASPRGFRGYLLLDDIHKAPPAVRWEVLSYIQGLFDSPNALVNVKGADGKIRSVSLRNLNVQMTLNPPDDPEVLAKLGVNPSDESLIIARLKHAECPFDTSALKRWTAIISLSKFPASAKAPKLRDSLVDAARNEFNLGNKFVLVAPQAVHRVVDQFKDVNAREFLGEATSRMMSILDHFQGGSVVYVVVPRATGSLATPALPTRSGSFDASGRETDKIANFIQDNFVAVPVSNRFVEGKLHLLGVMMDSFRTSLYESLTSAVTADERFVGQGDILLGPFLHALTSNLVENPFIPLDSLKLDPVDFGMGLGGHNQEQFHKALKSFDRTTKQFFPITFADEVANTGRIEAFMDHRAQVSPDRSRLHVLTDTSQRTVEITRRYMAAMLRVDQTTFLPKSDDWLHHLNETEPREAARQTGRDLANLFVQFLEEMASPELLENQTIENGTLAPTPFDTARLFMMAVDRAIMSMPWGRSVQFVGTALDRAARETDLGQLTGTQHYLFNSKYSLVRPAAHEGVLNMAAGSEAFKRWDETKVKQRVTKFNANCASFFRLQ